MSKVQRYEWEDLLVDAQTAGVISNGDLMVCLKLARQINWCPKDGRPAGLYWKNDDAFAAAGVGRSTYYKKRKSLLETGFFTQVNGNLLPTMPAESLVETIKSLLETKKSLVETPKSLGDNPLSEDTLSEDLSSEESFSDSGAAAPGSSQPSLAITSDTPLASSTEQSGLVVDEEVPESLLETFDDEVVEPVWHDEDMPEAPEPNQPSKETQTISQAVTEAPEGLPAASVVRVRAERFARHQRLSEVTFVKAVMQKSPGWSGTLEDLLATVQAEVEADDDW